MKLEDFDAQVATQSLLQGQEGFQRVGLFGGSFNPPHLGHLIMADQVLTQLGLDKVYFMPSHFPPHKEGKVTLEASHRVKMTQLAIQDHMGFGLETIELERMEKSYTYETIKLLKDRYPQREYYFILGGDMVEDLPNWYQIDRLVQEVKFVAVARPGYQTQSPYPLLWVESPLIPLSSTQIRQKAGFHQSIRYMVPEQVEAYIFQEGLYQFDE